MHPFGKSWASVFSLHHPEGYPIPHPSTGKGRDKESDPKDNQLKKKFKNLYFTKLLIIYTPYSWLNLKRNLGEESDLNNKQSLIYPRSKFYYTSTIWWSNYSSICSECAAAWIWEAWPFWSFRLSRHLSMSFAWKGGGTETTDFKDNPCHNSPWIVVNPLTTVLSWLPNKTQCLKLSCHSCWETWEPGGLILLWSWSRACHCLLPDSHTQT